MDKVIGLRERLSNNFVQDLIKIFETAYDEETDALTLKIKNPDGLMIEVDYRFRAYDNDRLVYGIPAEEDDE